MSYLSYQIRGGTRGGRDQFKWDDVRQMSHKDREQYLGQTVMIGFLDKGGKWRKKDWYTKDGVSQEEIDKQMEAERQSAIAKDQKRMRVALGLEKEEKKTISETATEEEKMLLLKQIREGMDVGKQEVNDWDDIQENDEQRGIGFRHSVEQLVKVQNQMDMSKFLNYDPTKLDAEGFSDDEKEKSKKDKKSKKEKRKGSRSPSMDNKDSSDNKTKKIKKEKKDKKEKKSKKDKKHKKDKKKHKSHKKRHDSSSSSSRSSSPKKSDHKHKK